MKLDTGSRRPIFNLISRDELRRLSWDEGKSDAEIAHLYGVSTNEVNRKRHQMKLVQGGLTTDQLTEIARTADAVRQLPWEGVMEVREVVQRYQPPTILH